MIKAYVTNLGMYNEGMLVGEWVTFPVTNEELQDVYKRIKIGTEDEFGCPYEEIFITDYECDIDGITDELGEYMNLEALNYLAGRLDELDRWETDTYEAVLEGLDVPQSGIEGLVNLTYNLDRYFVYSDVYDDWDLGKHYVDECYYSELKNMGTLANYIDYRAFGSDIQMDEG